MLFANADGGHIFLGVNEATRLPSGKIKKISQDNLNLVYRAALDYLVPPLQGVTCEEVHCPSYDNSYVLLITVPDSDRIHQTNTGQLARRRGSEREPIFVGREIHEIISKVNIDYDVTPILTCTLADLDSGAVASYKSRYVEKNPESKISDLADIEILRKKKAVVEVDAVVRPTITGMLFFGTTVDEVLPFAKVDFVQFPGPEIGGGSDGQMYLDRKTLTGTIPKIIQDCERLVSSHIATKGYLQNGFERSEVKEYPLFAYREAIINALCHRDYALTGTAIQIRLYSDRLEVHSPGRLPGHITIDNIVEESYARNPHVAALLFDMGYVEQLGIGIDFMVKTMVEAGLEPPGFIAGGNSFTVVLKHDALLDPDSLTWLKENFDQVDLSGNQRKGLVFIRKYAKLTNKDYRHLNEVTRDDASRDLRDLVSKGIIEQKGEAGGTYYVLPGVDIGTQIEALIAPFMWASLNKSMKRIMKCFEKRRRLTTNEIESLTGFNRRNIQRTVSALIKKGLIIRHGASISDPTSFYTLNEELVIKGPLGPLFEGLKR